MKNKHAVALGRLGGKKNTDAQLAARRLNAKKGGRPKSISVLLSGGPLSGEITRTSGSVLYGMTIKVPSNKYGVVEYLYVGSNVAKFSGYPN